MVFFRSRYPFVFHGRQSGKGQRWGGPSRAGRFPLCPSYLDPRSGAGGGTVRAGAHTFSRGALGLKQIKNPASSRGRVWIHPGGEGVGGHFSRAASEGQPDPRRPPARASIWGQDGPQHRGAPPGGGSRKQGHVVTTSGGLQTNHIWVARANGNRQGRGVCDHGGVPRWGNPVLLLTGNRKPIFRL